MLFLINNPGIAFILLVVIGFTVLMGTKIFEEIKLNSALSLKQRQMRISNPIKSFKSRIALLSSAALAPVAAVIIVASVALNPQALPSGNLVDVKSADDVFDIYTTFNERMSDNYDTWGFTPRDGDLLGAPEGGAQDGINYDSEGQETNDDTGSDDYSGTNVQVEGVDEMDNVLTDGKYIYTMTYNSVKISLAYTTVDGPDVLSLYKTFEYDNYQCDEEQFYPQGLYVDDDYLIIIGNQYMYECKDYDREDGEDGVYEDDVPMPDYIWYQSSTHIKVLVFDKNNDFELLDEYKMNGYFTGTRKIGSNLYIVTNNYIPFYDEDVDIDYYLSEYEVNGQVTKALYEDVVYIEGSSPNSFTTFYGIDLDTTQVNMETILGDSGYTLYASNENMYLVGAVYYFWPMVDFVTIEEPVYESKTAIMKVSIDDGEVEYKATGMVSGYSLNQFSMDEYEGYLRITTTTGWSGPDVNNRLYILDENLDEVAVLENLGKPGETIKSTRFVGEYAYIVTYEQIDPFYVIDLSDPTNPVVAGELLIPGFSTYLQPLGEDHMLGIGFGDNSGGTNGLKISIYDISDKSNPFVFDEIIFDYSEFGWGHSTVTYNHKDLLVSLSKGIIALPFSTYSFGDSGYKYNSGILVYNIDLEDGFAFNGYVTHGADLTDSDSAYDVYVYKSKFIDQYFYTISDSYIKVSTIEDTETITHTLDLN